MMHLMKFVIATAGYEAVFEKVKKKVMYMGFRATFNFRK